MPVYGLLGETLAHTFSPRLFQEIFQCEGRSDCRYLTFELPDIGDLMELLAEYPDLEGFNVTIPYKQLIMPYLKEVSPQARWVGAVNTVKIERSGNQLTLRGYNTDIQGFEDATAPRLGARRHALVLGTGGASKAVMLALARLGVEARSVSRTPNPGLLTYADLTPELMRDAQIIVNATPLGTFPNVSSAPPIPYELVEPGSLCLDLVYNPSPTEFMKRCAARGAETADGLEMLRLQALASWRIWTSE